jgi:O-antigen biosynthesis protein
MSHPTVSIITPICPTEFRYINDCINSVINQTYPKNKLELIICLDNNQENNINILKNIISETDQIEIKLIINKEHEGISKCRNNAISNSEGEWLFILDSDDLIRKNAIDTLISHIKPGVAMIYSDHAKVSSDLNMIRYIRKKNIYHNLIKKYENQPLYNPMYSSVYITASELINKEKFLELGGYQKNLGEKPPVWISILEAFGAKNILYVPEILYCYRENENGIVARKENDLIKAHEQTFFENIKKFSDDIFCVKYIGRIKPFMVRHFIFIDANKNMIKNPYIDYGRMSLNVS